MKPLLLTLAFSLCVIFAQEPSSPVTLIQHVTVINVVTGEEAKEQTVKLQGGRIVSVASTAPGDGGSAGAVDGHGGFLISWLMGHACPRP